MEHSDGTIPPGAGQGLSGEDLLKAILESASQGILAVDQEGRIVLANTKAAEMFGCAQPELIGETVESLLPEAAREVHIQHREEYFAAPRVRPMGAGLDLAARRRDGTEFLVEISLSYITSPQGLLAIAFVSDITGRKRLEEQLLQSQKMEAVGRLAGGIAHDFNNLLTIISGYNSLMLGKLSPFDPLRGYSEEVSKAAERASALTKQLLGFSRHQVIQPKTININALIADAEKMLRRLIGEDIEMVFVPQPDIGNVQADPGQMEQVIFNLVVNARDALPKGGRITIETANVSLSEEYAKTHLGVRPGPYVMIGVTDTGVGMDAATRSRIFEPFFTTKEGEKGTGLGLATVYGVVKQNGGDIWVYSEPGKGTTFKIYLPRHDKPVTVAAPSEAAGPPVTGTVLVVEDEPGVRQLIVEVLRQQGYTVLEATDSLQAIQTGESYKGSIDLLLTDVVMPHSSGRELAERLLAARPGIRVLYISGYAENAIVHHGVLESDVQFLPKPFSYETLLLRVREVLAKSGRPRSR